MNKSFLLIAVILMCSCNLIYRAQDKKAERKEQKKIKEAKQQILLHRDEFVGIVSELFPCVPKKIIDTSIVVDDTAYKRWANETINQMQQWADSLAEEISFLQLDSMNYSELKKRQGYVISSLKTKLQNTKPIIQYIPTLYPVADSAQLKLLELKLQQKDKVIAVQTETVKSSNDKLSSATKWKGYSLWTWGILLAFIIGFIISKIYSK